VTDVKQPRILLTRTGHIGDCVLTLPMLCALRDHFPQAFIAWAVERPADQFIAHHGAIDQVISLRRGWIKRPSEIFGLRRQLRALSFDICIDPQSRTRSAMIAWLAGAPRRLGWRYPDGKDVALWLNNDRHAVSRPHVVDRQLDLLKPLGIESPKVRFDYPIQQSAMDTTIGFLNRNSLTRRDRQAEDFAVINAGAGWFSRRWPPQRYGFVAKYLKQSYGLPSVVTWAGDDERELAEAVVDTSQGAAILAPPTNLGELAALLRQAKFYLGSDTGPMHFATAVGTPCVGLFGTTRPECSGAYGPHHVAVQAFYQSGGGIARRNGGNPAMQAITTEMVCQGCDQMIANQKVRFPRREVA